MKKGPRKIFGLKQVETAIYLIGEKQRDKNLIKNRLERLIEQEKARISKEMSRLNKQIEELLDKIYQFAKENRGKITKDEKIKIINLISGQFGWRKTPPRINVKDLNKAIRAIKKRNLDEFLRISADINKMAMRQKPDLAKEIPGIEITQEEAFFVKPEETKIKVEKILKKIALKRQRKSPEE